MLRPRSPRAHLQVEALEARYALSGVSPTAHEQLMLEQLNDARANPVAYGQSIGLDLSGLAPAQPLAFDPRLIQAARGHSQDMSARNFFAHINPSNQDPGARLTAAGYPWRSWGESIAAGFSTSESALSALIIDAGVPDLGHRKHLLAMQSYFRTHRQVGIGIHAGTGVYRDYYTIETGVTADARPILTGVVFDDVNRNGKFDLNEGRGNHRVEVWSGASLVASSDTFQTGGYGIQVAPGTYTVRLFSGAVLASQTVTLGSENVRMRFNLSTLGTAISPAPPPTPAREWPALQGNIYAVGSDSGVPSEVRIYTGNSREIATLNPYGGFTGGVRVAVGDINGDGYVDVVTAAGPGAPGGHVKVFSGRDLSEMTSFFAYPGFVGGVTVATGDTNGDGRTDIIIGSGPGAPGGHVKVFSGTHFAELTSFFSFGLGFTGGVSVAAGDTNGDGRDDVIVGAGAGAPGGHIKVFSGTDFRELTSFFAYGMGFTGGVNVSAGDTNGDGRVDVIVGAAAAATHVKIFDGATPNERASFLAYPGAALGVRVGVTDRNGDGKADLVTSPMGAAPHVRVFSGPDLSALDSFFTAIPVKSGGLFISGNW